MKREVADLARVISDGLDGVEPVKRLLPRHDVFISPRESRPPGLMYLRRMVSINRRSRPLSLTILAIRHPHLNAKAISIGAGPSFPVTFIAGIFVYLDQIFTARRS